MERYTTNMMMMIHCTTTIVVTCAGIGTHISTTTSAAAAAAATIITVYSKSMIANVSSTPYCRHRSIGSSGSTTGGYSCITTTIVGMY